jgi:hypothetical protein
LLLNPERRTPGQKRHVDAFLRACPDARDLRRLALQFRAMLRWRKAKRLAAWMHAARSSDFHFVALGDTGVVLEDLGARTLTMDHRGSRRRTCAGGHRRGVLRHDEKSTLAAQFLLHGPAQIEHQMKSIRDLPRLGCPAAHSVGVRSVAVAADDLDAGMAPEPSRDRIGGAHGEEIHHTATLQVDQDRAEMLLPLLPGPIIDAQHTERRIGRGGRGAAFDEAHDGVGTDGHAQPRQQAFTGAPTQGVTDQMHDAAQPVGVLHP